MINDEQIIEVIFAGIRDAPIDSLRDTAVNMGISYFQTAIQ